eukprot:1195281-Prorocentrum_minimum.AAC.4
MAKNRRGSSPSKSRTKSSKTKTKSKYVSKRESPGPDDDRRGRTSAASKSQSQNRSARETPVNEFARVYGIGAATDANTPADDGEYLRRGEGLRRRHEAAQAARRNVERIKNGDTLLEKEQNIYDPADFPQEWKIFRVRGTFVTIHRYAPLYASHLTPLITHTMTHPTLR